MKVCKDCGCEKSITEFAKHPRTGTQPRCKECQRQLSKQWYRENKAKQIASVRKNNKRYTDAFKIWKSAQKCSVCGESHPPCLEFHHLDSDDKIGDVSNTKMQSIPKIVAELNKCAVLCANCHRKVHSGLIDNNTLIQLCVTADDIMCK